MGKNFFQLIRVAKREGVYVFRTPTGYLDYLDMVTGKSLGSWWPLPTGHYLIGDDRYEGGPFQCLNKILAMRKEFDNPKS